MSRLDAVLGEPVEEVPVEKVWTEKSFVAPSHAEYEAERREHQLVERYHMYLRGQRHAVCRLKILPRGEAKPIFCDLFDQTANMLVEAKGTVTRNAVRMAIGQLADYKRFVDPAPRLAILLPTAPRADLCDLLTAEGIEVVWPVGSAFTAVGEPGAR